MTAFYAFMITASAMLGQTEVTESTLPDNVVKEMEYFVGDWTVEGDVFGMPLKGRWTARWSPRKHCLLITNPKSLGGEKILGHGMMGWDTEKEEILVFMFFSDGVFEDGRYKLDRRGCSKAPLSVRTVAGCTPGQFGVPFSAFGIASGTRRESNWEAASYLGDGPCKVPPGFAPASSSN